MKLLAIAAALMIAASEPAQISCLTNAVYHESRGESLEGQQAVAWVVINRVNADKYPDTACDVISQPSQFSFYGVASSPVETVAWVKAVAVAAYVYVGSPFQVDPTKGALSFHSTAISNPWPKLKKTVKIDNHVFYR